MTRRIPALEQSYPGGCPDPDWCAGNGVCYWDCCGQEAAESSTDSRDPDYRRKGTFQTHNCSYCAHGDLPCKNGDSHRCEYPHARND